MEDLHQQQILEKIESDFYLSNGLLAILFLVSLSGLLVGLTGWIFSTVLLWMIPDSYYVIISLAAFILMGLTLIGQAYIRNLRVSYAKLKASI